jgi:hypothetical protein
MDFVRDLILIPFSIFYLLADRLYESLDQTVLWGAFVLGLLALSFVAILRTRWFPGKSEVEEKDSPGRVAVLTSWLDLVSKGSYFEWRMSYRLSQLAIDYLAFAESISEDELKEKLQQRKLDIPTAIQEYMRIGLQSRFFDVLPSTRWRPWNRTGPPRLPLALEQSVEFLETKFHDQDQEAMRDRQ